MRPLKIRFFVSLFYFLITIVCFAEKHAIVFIKPVANLISKEPKTYQKFEQFLNNYSPEKGPTCPRTFQALFGEMGFVEDIQLHDGYVHVELANCFFADKPGEVKPLYYWANRADFMYWEELTAAERTIFPPPIFYQKPELIDAINVVTLAEPWVCAKNGLTYSVGTRFIRASADTNSKKCEINLFDVVTGKRINESIPRRLLVNRGEPIPAAEKRYSFVKLLKKWCKKKVGLVPYIWGGASYVSRTKNENFRLVEDFINGEKVSFWTREESKNLPDGFDCSGLVLRAAQACGIAYFSRTAGTAANILKPLAGFEVIEPGDLFVTAGHNHIFVAAGDDLIVEAAGYSSGYACVHLISIIDRFLNARTYQDFLALFRAGQVPVYRCKDGRGVTPSGFAIVKLPV